MISVPKKEIQRRHGGFDGLTEIMGRPDKPGDDDQRDRDWVITLEWRMV